MDIRVGYNENIDSKLLRLNKEPAITYETVDDFKRAMKAKILSYTDKLAEGRAANWEEYRYTAGIIKGLKDALDVFANRK